MGATKTPGANGIATLANGMRPVVEPPVLGSLAHTDYYMLDELLTDDQRALKARIRSFMDTQVAPIINPYWERAEFPFELVPKLAGLNITGFQIPGFGCPGMGNLTAGLSILELARGDLSLATFMGVQSVLAMTSISLLGSNEQKQRWLPPMARLERIGAFGLTEPYHSTDAVVLETSAPRDGDAFVLNGYKRWIGNGTFADYVVVWARGEEGHVGGYIVEKGMPGFDTQFIAGKSALRCVQNAQISFNDVRVPVENRLANGHTFRDTETVLLASRFCVAWEALGAALAGYETAPAYAQQRHQFGAPLSSYQLIQERLAGCLRTLPACCS